MVVSSTYRHLNGHYQIWIMNGVTRVPDEIRHWLDTVAGGFALNGGRWIGAVGAGSMNGDRAGLMYNFNCRKTALLFKLTWG